MQAHADAGFFNGAVLIAFAGEPVFARRTGLRTRRKERVSIILLANLETAPMHKLSRDLSAIAFGEPYETPTVRRPVEVDPSVYAAYVGEYEITPAISLHVFTEEGRLLVQATNQPINLGMSRFPRRICSRADRQ